MASRLITDLTPEMQILFAQWDVKMKALNIDYIITCTLRSQSEQEALYAQGRTTTGPVVTWTLLSKHLPQPSSQKSKAFDFCIMNSGKCDWTMFLKNSWNMAVQIGKQLGMSQVVNSEGKIMEFAHLQII